MANQDQNSSSSASQSTAHRELTPMEDLRSPFFLHHGESPGAILVTQLLTEDNYPNWARAMLMALDAKSKLGFVDGSITASMAVTPLEKIAWSKNNSMISSWILNSVSPHITASVIYRNTTMEVWNSFRNRFSQANGPRISQLQKMISTIMQGDATVTTYFTNLQASWDQLLNLRPLPSCSCGRCICGVNDKITLFNHQDTLMQFLNGLNEAFSQVRTQILMMEPTLAVKTQGFNQGGKNKGKGRPVCSHCGKLGHFMEKCYKIMGFPPRYKQKGRVSVANQVTFDGETGQFEAASQSSSFPFTAE
ncbi:uncharacterized protein LOC112010560 [Quercus suber]|uniref:uncharacterized protein LOC112010560 n=1 Tax=Quercus suber TaxID=58331 RepID=UPI000CE22E0E|nr:uncharacterized protein LOC112010560 [Quercus suber]